MYSVSDQQQLRDSNMIHKIRRVVTGHDAQGRSTFIYDDIAGSVVEMESMSGNGITDLWETSTIPADNRGNADAVARPVRLEPQRTGSIFRVFEVAPVTGAHDVSAAATAFASIGGAQAHVSDDHSDPMRHKTNTIDYVVVLKGEVYAVLDTGETLLKPGDVLIQRGTVHSWQVRGNESCIMAAILIGAKP